MHKDSFAGCSVDCKHDSEIPGIDLLSPLKIKGIELKNRIVMSPMCQYCAKEGLADDWHLVHLGSRAVGGTALVFVEATAVTPQGRITLGDLGIWSDEHRDALKKIVSFVHAQNALIGIQLAHAGRKASCDLPWKGGRHLSIQGKAWQTIAPSNLPFNEEDPAPHSLNENEIQEVITAFVEGAKRAVQAGFDVIEIHSAHGYLIHEFLSPISNKRQDQWGGSLENRTRLLLTIIKEVKKVLPKEMPLFVRISATDWVENGWDEFQSVELAKYLKNEGVDLIDVSSGGLVPKATIPVAKNYQVPFAKKIRNEADILTAAVGLITEAEQANEIITSGSADLIFIGRELLREPYWAIKAEKELNTEPEWPTSYGYVVKRRIK